MTEINKLSPIKFSLMAKPMGAKCNSSNCFYSEEENLLEKNKNIMSDKVLYTYIQKYIDSQPGYGSITFYWQAEEASTKNLDFFKQAMKYQREHNRSREIINKLQTNGRLLNDNWGEFLSAEKWIVKLSIDGPKEINNNKLKTSDIFEKGIEILYKHNIPFSTLVNVTSSNVKEPLKMYDFLKYIKTNHIEFTPIIEKISNKGDVLEMTPWSVKAKDYGNFLCTIFDEWVAKDVGKVKVMNFEWTMANILRKPAENSQWMPTCSKSLVINYDGDIYPCTQYMDPNHKIGTIIDDDLQEIVQSISQVNFKERKLKELPSCCRTCDIGSLCWGGCYKQRLLNTHPGEGKLNYLCEGYKHFFTHVKPQLENLYKEIN